MQAGTTRYIYNGDGQLVRKIVSPQNQTVYIGQYVEMQITATPPAAPTPRPTWTAQPPTPTFVNTPTPTVTRTATITRTYTKTVAKTATPTRTRTPTTTRTVNPATYTATITRTPYSTATRTVTSTPNPAHTATRTRTAIPTTKVPTATTVRTSTRTPTKTKTGSPTPTRTLTFTPTRTPIIPTAFPEPTITPTPIPALIPAGQEWRFYYFAGAQRIAMRYKGPDVPNAYTFFLSDHLGSTTLTVLPNGTQAGKMLYKAFGEQRYSSGTTPMDYRYTGQLSQVDAVGLYYYGARWYDPALGRFTQADTLIPQPGNPLDWDRYAYVRNSPINYTDPNGHKACLDFDSNGQCIEDPDWRKPAPDVPLTTFGSLIPGVNKSGGEGVYELYLQYKSTCGWWNEECTANFGIAEFVGLWVLSESAYAKEDPLSVAQAISQNLYVGGWNEPACDTARCFNAILNFMAAYSKGVGALFQGPNNKANQKIPKNHPDIAARSFISKWGNTAIDSSTVVTRDQNNGPTNWGNVVGANSISSHQVYYKASTGRFVIFSINEYYALIKIGVDMSLVVGP